MSIAVLSTTASSLSSVSTGGVPDARDQRLVVRGDPEVLLPRFLAELPVAGEAAAAAAAAVVVVRLDSGDGSSGASLSSIGRHVDTAPGAGRRRPPVDARPTV